MIVSYLSILVNVCACVLLVMKPWALIKYSSIQPYSVNKCLLQGSVCSPVLFVSYVAQDGLKLIMSCG